MLHRVLLVDEDVANVAAVQAPLRASVPGATVDFHCSKDGLPGLDFDWSGYDLLILTHRGDAVCEPILDWYARVSHEDALPPTLVLAAEGNEELAVRSMKLGAVDYLNLASLSSARLAETVADAVQCLRIRRFDEGAERRLRRNADSEALTVSDLFGPGPPARGDARASIDFTIPGYLVSGLLGTGGMASVLLANRVDDGLAVALKVVPLNHDAFQAQILRGFMREYSVLAELLHPNVVHIYERAFSNEFAYIAMEYLSGGDLRARIDEGLTLAQIKAYVSQIAGGLGAAHALDIVHRDVKPANVLFREDGTLALIDFGVAMEIDGVQSGGESEPAAGTPHYLSPEQIQGHPVDARSDLYSLGVVLYEMATGQQPFAGRELAEILRCHVMLAPPPMTGEARGLQPLVEGLLAKDPDDRFQSAEEVLDALDWV